jgi:hypothetical protein
LPYDYNALWGSWNGTAATYTVTNITTGGTTNNYAWPAWNDVYQSTGTYTNNVLWGQWVNGQWQAPQPYVPPVLTPEEVEAQRLAVEVANRAWRERQAAIVAEEAEASVRAERLLVEHLSDEQRAEYELLKRFHVIVGDRKYRVERGWSGNVKLIEAAPDGEFVVESHCIHPREQVPYEDNMLAQKLLLEADEEAFRRISNISRLRRAA